MANWLRNKSTSDRSESGHGFLESATYAHGQSDRLTNKKKHIVPMICLYCEMCACTLSLLAMTLRRMFAARLAYLSVLCVSSKHRHDGDMLAITGAYCPCPQSQHSQSVTVCVHTHASMCVPSESLSRRVGFESR